MIDAFQVELFKLSGENSCVFYNAICVEENRNITMAVQPHNTTIIRGPYSLETKQLHGLYPPLYSTRNPPIH